MGDKNCNKILKLGSDRTPNNFWQDNRDHSEEMKAPACQARALSTAVYGTITRGRFLARPAKLLLLFGSWTLACPLRSEAARVSHGPDNIHEYAFVVVLQIGQVVGEAGEVVADASLQILSDMTIDRGQRAAAVLI